jgi:hypothetical protein
MSTFSNETLNLASYVGDDIGAMQAGLDTLIARVGENANLNTTAKATLVAAINELKGNFTTLQNQFNNLPAPESELDDTHTGAEKGWSAQKISSQIADAVNTLKQSLLGGVGADADTFSELLSLITNNENALETISALTGSFVSFKTNQTLTEAQKTTALNNIGAASAAMVATLQQFVTDFGDVKVKLVERYESRRIAAGGPAITRV